MSSQSQTLLIVDDEQSLLSLLVRELQEHGFTVLQACNGDEALQKCKHHVGPIHLLLADIFLPTKLHFAKSKLEKPAMHGLELARRVMVLRPHIRVLFISGHTDEEIRSLGDITPGTPFLKKPFSSDTLIRKVREVLSGSG